MAKAPKGSSSNSTTAKSGKKHGQVTYPAPLSAERRAAKEQGEQQFYSPRTQTFTREVTKIEYDQALKGFVYRTKKVTDTTEHSWDASRGRVIVSPKFKEKGK